MQSSINRITDILRRDDGISGAMQYTEQISWILFLKYLDDFEKKKAQEAFLNGVEYRPAIDAAHKWNVWACPKDERGKLDLKLAKTGDDLKDYVNRDLFPYLKGFKLTGQDVKTVQYKIGGIFEFLDNKIASGHTLREVLNIIDELNFQSKEDIFELSHIYENLLQGMGNDGGNSGEFYTPRAVIRTIVEVVNPKIGQTVYDGAVGSAGFLVEAFEYLKKQVKSTEDQKKLDNETIYGNEKTPLAYVMGMMNLILHGVESPNISKQNTLTKNVRDIQEKDRFDVILANPPFGGMENPQIQQNFPIQANATELLFLQHFMKSLKLQGKAAIVVPEGVLFSTNNAFTQVKKELLENFNLHTILSLPAGVFLPYSGVKTDVLFFDRTGATKEIWYYECVPAAKLTKNKPIKYEHLEGFVKAYETKLDSEVSWKVGISEIVERGYDISAKNPNRNTEVVHLPPVEILANIRANDAQIAEHLDAIEAVLASK